MKKYSLFSLLILVVSQTICAQVWQAKWIAPMESQSATNTWLAYRKEIKLFKIPENATAYIAVDSKYWLWINGKLVIFEGGLKRGPDRVNTYYDQVNLTPYLKKGNNTIAVLVWYFGKNGFSHNSSGKAGLLFDCNIDGLKITSDRTWKCAVLNAFKTASDPIPNFRLPESSLLYDARLDVGFWQGERYDDNWMHGGMELGAAGAAPWNTLIKRPIPFWKDYGVKKYKNQVTFPFVSTGDTIIGELPYDAQITPYFKIGGNENRKITIFTDNFIHFSAGDTAIKAEYITKNGIQEYESFGWMNGHKVYYIIPRGIKIINLGFRETGYNTDFDGYFHCSDSLLNKYWLKARRTVYVNMRDTYMDCPERERAQWPGDQMMEAAQAYSMFSPSSYSLSRKFLLETIAWCKDNGGLFGPVPAGNWNKELPDQILASMGYFGIWNYYLHTGDKKTLIDTYDGIKKYLSLWEPDGKGTVKVRKGDWTWGDWGKEKDIDLIYNIWYYLAIKSMYSTAILIGKYHDAKRFETFMSQFKLSFNKQFWTGKVYRSPDYIGMDDDRSQALAVVADLVSVDKFPAILKVLQTEEHSSPYMEKFVLEAMFKMGYIDEGLTRFKKRFAYMIENPLFTTLFEGWFIGKEGFGGGSVNHGWAGGGAIVLSQYLCGVYPDQPGYKSFRVLPFPGSITNAQITLNTLAGKISSRFINSKSEFDLQVDVPIKSTAVVGIPNDNYQTIFLNNNLIWKNGKYINNSDAIYVHVKSNKHIRFKIRAGQWQFRAQK